MSDALKLLCDTNVWLDNYLGFRPNHRAVARFFSLATKVNAELLIPFISLKDFYYLVQLELKRTQAVERGCEGHSDREPKDDPAQRNAAAIRRIVDAALDSLVEIATIVGADASDVWLARKQGGLHNDFEDDLVIAAAFRAKVDFLVTSDQELIKHAPVAALTPSDMAAYLQPLLSNKT